MNLQEYLFSKCLNGGDPRAFNMNGVIVELTVQPSLTSDFSIIKPNKIDLDEHWSGIISSEEFSNCSGLYRYQFPYIVDDEGMIIEPTVVKLDGKTRFMGKCFVMEITMHERRAEKNSRYEPVFNNACLTDVRYDEKTHEPFREIVIRINPSDGQNQTRAFRERTLKLVEEILRIPDMYARRPEVDVVLRGYFERVESMSDSSGIFNLVSQSPLSKVSKPWLKNSEYFLAFYMDISRVDDHSMNSNEVHLKRCYIPSTLKEEFGKEFSQGITTIRKQELREFLSSNDRQDIIELNRKLGHAL